MHCCAIMERFLLFAKTITMYHLLSKLVVIAQKRYWSAYQWRFSHKQVSSRSAIVALIGRPSHINIFSFEIADWNLIKAGFIFRWSPTGDIQTVTVGCITSTCTMVRKCLLNVR